MLHQAAYRLCCIQVIDHIDALGRAYLCTGAAADTFIGIETGTSAEGFLWRKRFGREAGRVSRHKHGAYCLFQDSRL
jgi:hypothetical protein